MKMAKALRIDLIFRHTQNSRTPVTVEGVPGLVGSASSTGQANINRKDRMDLS